MNHYDGLRLSPDRSQDFAGEDVAEIQRKPLTDTDGHGTPLEPERSS